MPFLYFFAALHHDILSFFSTKMVLDFGASMVLNNTYLVLFSTTNLEKSTMFWSDFVRYYAANAAHLPKTVRESIRRRATARYGARMLAGRAGGPLDFSDLIREAETCISGE